jgi:hypothetical protein
MYQDALNWIRTTYPYVSDTRQVEQGRDSLVTLSTAAAAATATAATAETAARNIMLLADYL